MPLNVNSATVTPQQAINTVGTDSIGDRLNAGKIGDNQVLYSSGKGEIKGNTFHSWFKNDENWQTEKQNAKNEVVNWVKSFGLNEKQTDDLLSHVENRFSQKGELRGRDLKEIAKLAQKQLEPFAEKPFVCTKNASPKELAKANLWLALNKNQIVGAKGNYQNGFTMARNPNASLSERANVPHALFSMTKLAQRPDVRQQQMLRSLSQLPPVPTHDIKTDSSEPFKPFDGADKKGEYNKEHDFKEAGSHELKPNNPNHLASGDNMKDFVAQDGFDDYAWQMQVKNSHINLGVDDAFSDADLLQILDDELGDDVEKLDINSDYLDSLREMMYEDFSEVEADYLDQLGDDNSGYVSPMKFYQAPEIVDDPFDD